MRKLTGLYCLSFYKLMPCVLAGIFYFSFSAAAQYNSFDSLPHQFNTFNNTTFQEKLFVHTDKNFYLAGEIIWFKIYNVAAGTNHLADVSKVAYVELLDENNKPRMQAKIELKKGMGDGSFYLPVSVNSGNYTFRAYTNWMKNFRADFYFSKPIAIINSLKPLNLPVVKDSAAIHISFFPEGGNLVSAVTSKVGFEITGKWGKGVDCTGTLLDDRNDTILRFQALKFGMGNFSFTPAQGHTYRAIVKTADGKSSIQQLPKIYEHGYVMHLSDEGNGKLKVTVQADRESAADAPDIFLFGQTMQVVKVAEKSRLRDGLAEFFLDKNILGDGISQLTVFNDKKQPVCERLYFKKPLQQMMVRATSDLQQYTSRKKVTVSVDAKDETKNESIANMSVAVYKLDSLQTADENNIFNYLWLTSGLQGHIESPDYYFTAQGTEAEVATDNLLLTHGWRRFSWDDILKNKIASFEYKPEYDGHIVSGKVVDMVTGKTANNVGTYLSVPGTKGQFYNAMCDSSGRIYFYTKKLYGQNEMVVQTDAQTDSIYRIEVANPFSEKYTPAFLPPLTISEGLQQSINKRSIGMQVQNAYEAAKLQHFGAPDIDTIPFYGLASKTYMLDEYTRFTTMEEVLREYVQEVGVRKRKGQYHLPVAREIGSRDPVIGFYDGEPLVLLDGVPVFEADKIMSYDPLKVKKLEVVTSRYFYGPFIFDGIISFSTYNGTMENLQLDPHAVVLDYEGLQLKRKFYSPTYDSDNAISERVPDFRNVLYWLPNMTTSPDGKAGFHFYTSDIKGKYNIVIQGITDEGKAGITSFTIDVK